MAHIIFINANLHGHINPTLPLVKRLLNSGIQVDYYCSGQFQDKVKLTGASLISYSPELDTFLTSYRPTDRHPFYMLMEYILLYAEAMLPEVLELINKNHYDMVIGDSLFGGPFFLKEIIQIPVVSSHSSFAMSKAPVPPSMLIPGTHSQLDYCYEILDRICSRYAIPVPELADVFTSRAEYNVVYTIPEFNGDDGLDFSKYLFAGATVTEDTKTEFDIFPDKTDQTRIYISLGSINTDHPEFYKMCIEAFEGSDYYVVMSVGNKCDINQLGTITLNFYVGNFLPQLAILKHMDVFITHAGFNSVHESLYFGVPMFALPMVNDQHMVAKRIKDMELGIVGKFKEIDPQGLRDGVNEILSDNRFKENCRRISELLKESDRLAFVSGFLVDLMDGIVEG